MNLTRTLAIAMRQYYLLRSSPVRLLSTVVWVALDIIVWGFITRYLGSLAPTMDLVPALLGAVLMWGFFIRTTHGMTIAFFEDVWSRNFLNIFATPLSVGEYIGGMVITAFATSLLGLVVMLGLATFIFGLSILAYGWFAVAFLLILFLSGIALGIIGSAIVLRFGPAAEWLVWPLPTVALPFVGVYYPLATLPLWMQWVGKALAPSYVFEAMRGIAAGSAVSGGGLVFGVILAAGYIAAAGWLFTYVYKKALRSGLIARYSAESLS